LTNMKEKFHERWITIRYRLTGKRPPHLDRKVIRRIQTLFSCLLPPWNYIRHAPECNREIKCHHVHKCCYKLPTYYFIIKELLFVVQTQEKIPDLMKTYEPYLLYSMKAKALTKLKVIWTQLADFNGWETSFTKVYEKNFDKDGQDMDFELVMYGLK